MVLTAIRRAPPWTILACGAIAFLLYAYPGQITWDGAAQMIEARTGVFTDTRPPVNALIWTWAEDVLGGTLGMLLIQSLAVMGGLYLLSRRALSARGAAWATTGLVLFPPIGVPLAVVSRDALMGGLLLLGLGLLLQARRRVRLAGVVAVFFAAAVRYEACAATLPVLLLAFRWPGLGGVRRIVAAAAVWIAVTLGAFGLGRALTDQPMAPMTASLEVYDIAGTLSFVDGTLPDAELEALLAGTELRLHTNIHAALRKAYDKRDYIGLVTGMKAPWALPLFGATPAPASQLAAIDRAWHAVVGAHRGAYLRHRFAVMKQQLFLAKPRAEIVVPYRTFLAHDTMLDLGLEGRWSNLQRTLTSTFAALSRETPLFVPWIYLALALILLPLARRHRDVLALLASALALELAQLFVTVARNFAASAWLITATSLAVVILVARRARAAPEPAPAAAGPRAPWRTLVDDTFAWLGHAVRTASPRAILVTSWLGAVLYAHPGYMSYDSVAQLLEARSGIYSDGHPPAMAAMWVGLDYLIAGPLLLVLLQLTVFLLGARAIFARVMRERPAALCAGLLLWFPPVLTTMAVAWKDSLMAALLVAGTALLLSERRRTRVLALLVLAAATATRHNALAMTLPLIGLLFTWAPDQRWFKRYPIALAAWVAVTLCAQTANGLLTDRKTFIWHQSLALYDMVGTLRFGPDVPDAELRDTFAGIPLRTSHDLQAALRSPIADDVGFSAALWAITDGFFVRPTTQSERDAVVRAWKHVVLHHPLPYLAYRWAVFRELIQLTDVDLGNPVYRWFADVQNPGESARAIDHSAVHSGLQRSAIEVLVWIGTTALYRIYVYLFATLVLLAFAWRDRRILALLFSGLVGEAALFLLTPTTDARYSFWLIVSTVMAVVMLVAVRGARGDRSIAATRAGDTSGAAVAAR